MKHGDLRCLNHEFDDILLPYIVEDHPCKRCTYVSFLSQSGHGVTLCIEKALADSGISKEDVNYINAHATSTKAGDLKEYGAIVRCFGQNPEVSFLSCITGTLFSFFFSY